MSLEKREEKQYEKPAGVVFDKAQAAIAALEGKFETEDKSAGQLKAKFDKKILGKTLGQRTAFEVRISEAGNGGSKVAITAIPLDAIGQPLKFGERKGVSRTVMDWFWAHLEHRLQNE